MAPSTSAGAGGTNADPPSHSPQIGLSGQVSDAPLSAYKLIPRSPDRDPNAWKDGESGAAADGPRQVYDPRGKDEGKPEHAAGWFGAVAASRAVSVAGGQAMSGEQLAEKLAEEDQLQVETGGAPFRFTPATVAGVQLKLEPVSPGIGTIVHGADLAKPLLEEMVRFLRKLLLDRKVIFFRGQAHVTQQQHRDFTAQFGAVGTVFGETPHERETGRFLSTAEGPNAASMWHSDATWAQRPPFGSLLICREAPPVGGDTLFCDAYAMYEALPTATKKKLAGLQAVHRGERVHAYKGQVPEAWHPALRTHPETGGTTLFVNPHFTRSFFIKEPNDLPQAESDLLLAQCCAHAGKPEFTCRFRWEVGSLAFWDNRACQHYGSGDYWPHTRRMERYICLDSDESRRKPFYSGTGSPSKL